MFAHLEEAEKKLNYKAIPWKKQMLQALQDAKGKLSKYYSATDTESFGQVYALATILCPSKKLYYFNSDDWKGEDEYGQPVDYMKIYKDALIKEFTHYQQWFAAQVSPGDIKAVQISTENPLDSWVDSQATVPAEVEKPEDEIMRYLSKGKQLHLIWLLVLTYHLGPIKGNIRAFWKQHEREYPVLAKMARDILSTPASGAGVEWLFNCARDVCHYRRGQLKPDTIRSLMLYQFASRFKLEQRELERIKQHLSSGEADMLETI